MKSEDKISYYYHFKFADGSVKEFNICLDKNTLDKVKIVREKVASWALMKNFKCPHCPHEKEFKYCPIAYELEEIIKEFKDFNSFDLVEVSVETPFRNYFKKVSLQSGISSVVGILMVSSGCKIMSKLKPLLYFHLPFATMEETEMRAFSLYLLAQYIKWQKGKTPDWEMKNLYKIYEEIRILNHNVAKKIIALEGKDANINSIIVLNNFVEKVTFTIDKKLLSQLELFMKEFIE